MSLHLVTIINTSHHYHFITIVTINLTDISPSVTITIPIISPLGTIIMSPKYHLYHNYYDLVTIMSPVVTINTNSSLSPHAVTTKPSQHNNATISPSSPPHHVTTVSPMSLSLPYHHYVTYITTTLLSALTMSPSTPLYHRHVL